MRNGDVDQLFIEGLLAIDEGEHPKSIEMRLQGVAA